MGVMIFILDYLERIKKKIKEPKNLNKKKIKKHTKEKLIIIKKLRNHIILLIKKKEVNITNVVNL